MDALKRLFEQHFQVPAEDVHPLQGELGSSGRAIVRLAGGGFSVIGILYPVREENIAFLEFSRHFRRHGLPVPQIYAEDLSQGAYLEEDLGDTSLFEFLVANRTGADVAPPAIEAYRKVVAILPRFQVEAGRDLNYKVCYPRSSFDRQSIGWDLNYFKYYFLRLAGVPFSEQALEHDFARLTKFLLAANHDYFLYRDFQSRNIMLRDGQPYFLDYQGGRKGALQYDIASLLYDGKADLPPELRQELLDYYLDCLGGFISVDREAFMEHYYAYVYVRIMQALGAYGFRGFYERKAHFLQSVPYALKNLRWLAHNVKLPIALPALMNAFNAMLASDKLQGLASSAEALTVRIFSFCFHRQMPADESWNGGGFDLPVLQYRSLKAGVQAPRYWETGDEDNAFRYNNYLSRYHWRHLDLMDVLSSHNGRARASLADMAALLGLPGKLGFSGAQVWEQYLAANIVGVRRYCETDVLNTYLIYLRFELMRGQFTRERHAAELERVKALLRASAEPHCAEFLRAWEAPL